MNNTVVPTTLSQEIDIMAAYHTISEVQISTILVVELANDNYEIVGNDRSFFLTGNDLSNYLNNLPASVKITYQFLEDFS